MSVEESCFYAECSRFQTLPHVRIDLRINQARAPLYSLQQSLRAVLLLQ